MKSTAALSVLALATSLAACTRPAPQTPSIPAAPETFSLTATTVRRTDTAAPAADTAAAPAGDTAAPAAAVGDAATPAVAATEDASAPASATPAAESPAHVAARTALDAQHAALAHCYDEILSTAPEAVGRANVEIAVNPGGAISRVEVRVDGDGGLAQARTCIEAAMRAVRFTEIPGVGAVVRRSYSFVNPPVEIAVSQALRVQPPARGAAAAAAPTAPTASARGVLTDAEVGAQMALAVPALQACYATTLRRAARAAGTGEVRFSVQGNGEVASATWSSAVAPIALMGECVGAAARALRFRSSGTAANVRANIEFAR
jgi:hypothetical protein